MLYQKKKHFRFIDDVHEINNQSCCILSGPPCIGWHYLEMLYIPIINHIITDTSFEIHKNVGEFQ